MLWNKKKKKMEGKCWEIEMIICYVIKFLLLGTYCKYNYTLILNFDNKK